MLEQGPDFWRWFYITRFSCHCVHPIHAKVFSIQMLLHFSQIVPRVCTSVLFIWNAGVACIEVEYALHNEYYYLLQVHTWRPCNSSFSTYLSFRGSQTLSPQNCNEGHFYLQQCKPHSNTVTRTPTKWDVSQRVTLCLLFWAEPERRKQLELVNFSSHVILSFKEKKSNQPEQSYFVRKKLLRQDSNPHHTAC